MFVLGLNLILESANQIQFPCSQIYAVYAVNICSTWIIIILNPMNAIVVLGGSQYILLGRYVAQFL